MYNYLRNITPNKIQIIILLITSLVFKKIKKLCDTQMVQFSSCQQIKFWNNNKNNQYRLNNIRKMLYIAKLDTSKTEDIIVF